MTQKQLSKLETRIATLKAQKRIVWIEGINAEVIKGKIAGKAVFFVKADSLNKNGGSWYYIARWQTVGYQCSCEYVGYKQCQHTPEVSEYNYQQHQREFKKHMAAIKAEAIEKAADLQEYKKIVREAEQQPTEADRAEAQAVSQRLQADLVLHQAEQYTKAIDRSAYNAMFDPCAIA